MIRSMWTNENVLNDRNVRLNVEVERINFSFRRVLTTNFEKFLRIRSIEKYSSTSKFFRLSSIVDRYRIEFDEILRVFHNQFDIVVRESERKIRSNRIRSKNNGKKPLLVHEIRHFSFRIRRIFVEIQEISVENLPKDRQIHVDEDRIHSEVQRDSKITIESVFCCFLCSNFVELEEEKFVLVVRRDRSSTENLQFRQIFVRFVNEFRRFFLVKFRLRSFVDEFLQNDFRETFFVEINSIFSSINFSANL